MKIRTNLVLLTLVLVSVGFTAACPKRVSIGDIEANPSKYQNKTVAVAGVVKESFGVTIPGTSIRGGVYRIDDGTGSIWVLTEDSVPTRGAEIGVQGKIGTGITWNGRNYGLGMHEKDRSFRKK